MKAGTRRLRRRRPGPGRPDHGARRRSACGSADVVLFDSLADPALRALAPQASWIDVGKRGFSGVAARRRAAAARTPARTRSTRCSSSTRGSGQRVVRLKGGDPSVFGRLEEELEALAAAGIACEVVPGVTAALAAAARPSAR